MLCADQLKTSTSTLAPPPPLPHSRANPAHLNVLRLDRSILYSLHSMTKTNYAAKIPLTVQLPKKKKIHFANCHISSFQLFHLVQTAATSAPEKKKAHLKPDNSGSIFYTRPRQRSNSPPPRRSCPSTFPLPGHRK